MIMNLWSWLMSHDSWVMSHDFMSHDMTGDPLRKNVTGHKDVPTIKIFSALLVILFRPKVVCTKVGPQEFRFETWDGRTKQQTSEAAHWLCMVVAYLFLSLSEIPLISGIQLDRSWSRSLESGEYVHGQMTIRTPGGCPIKMMLFIVHQLMHYKFIVH